jgi:hypothetical protein
MTLLAEEYVEACLTHRALSTLEHDDAVDHHTDMEEMPRSVTVHVTQRHIDQGVCAQPAACAGALAVTEVLGLPAELGGKMATVLTPGRDTVRYYLPEEMRNWVRRFDVSKALVEPVTFTMTRVG